MKPLFLLFFSSVFFSSVFIASKAFGAACCGGGFSVPSLIAGDEAAQVSASYAYTNVNIDNVDANGVWHKSDEHQEVRTLRIEGAHIFFDRWQAGFALPIVQREKFNEVHSGLGDVSASLGYEFLPDWDYNPWRPKGLGFMQVTLPTGVSRVESENGGLDSRGNGFWAVSLGTLLSKTFGKFDVFTNFEAHRSFAKQVSNSVVNGRVQPGFGANLGIGGGYNYKSARFGSSLTWTYEDPVAITGTLVSAGAVERYATAAMSASYLYDTEWSGTLAYSDQTWFGSPVNTSLGKTISIFVQKRWLR